MATEANADDDKVSIMSCTPPRARFDTVVLPAGGKSFPHQRALDEQGAPA